MRYVLTHTYISMIVFTGIKAYKTLMSDELLTLSVAQLTAHYQDKSLSPVEVARFMFARMQALNPLYNAFAHMASEEELLEQARQSEGRWQQGKPCGMLDGVPVTIKDWYHIKGWPTRYGSLCSSDDLYEEDSPCVARLREAGALFLGKTTLPEYGHKGATHSPLSGITRNPWDTDKTPGGSSGGAAVAAATMVGYVHLGSDAGGSIRIPAGFTGVFGMKPTPMTVPHAPHSLVSPLSSAGALARCAEDAQIMLDIITRPDARDSAAVAYDPLRFGVALGVPEKRLKIAYAPTINNVAVHAEIAASVKSAVDTLSSDHDVEEIELNVHELIETFNAHWTAVASYTVSQMPSHIKEQMDPWFLHWAKRGDELGLHDYLRAQNKRLEISAQFRDLFGLYDALILPTTALPAFKAGENSPIGLDGEVWDDWTPFTFPANLAGLPASSLPCGLTSDGLPVGIQVVSGYLKDDLVMALSKQIAQRAGFQDWVEREKSVIVHGSESSAA